MAADSSPAGREHAGRLCAGSRRAASRPPLGAHPPSRRRRAGPELHQDLARHERARADVCAEERAVNAETTSMTATTALRRMRFLLPLLGEQRDRAFRGDWGCTGKGNSAAISAVYGARANLWASMAYGMNESEIRGEEACAYRYQPEAIETVISDRHAPTGSAEQERPSRRRRRPPDRNACPGP